MKIVVIGGGAAGMMFSTQYKKANPEHEVFLFEKSPYVAWAGCPTPYYIADELSINDVVLGTAEDFIKRGVNVKIHHEVTGIDFKNKTLNVTGNEINGIFSYDKLVLAVGAKSFIPDIKDYSSELSNVFTLSHAENAIEIKKYITENKASLKNALIAGAGFIGLETAESFNKLGLNVTVVEKSGEIFPSVSENLKKGIYSEIEKRGVSLKLNAGVAEIISGNNVAKAVKLDNGETLNFDIALFSIGITPNIGFISDELETEKGKIVVNDKFETNISDVYAIGDCIFNKYYNTDRNLYAPFGDVANKHGILLSKYLSGENIHWKGLLRSYATSFYDIKLAQTGLSLDEATVLGYNAEKIDMKAMYKNSGFADSVPAQVEIIYDKDKKVLLGGTMVGREAVAQFIDQIAIVITLETPIEKFIDIDFAYSPTNASVWNPLLVTYRKVIK
ncbi:FAD-dependent oxidoreductase [Pseudoleptotrichia goodfellowii]|uniref:Pyridine nucleotide-disulfide oxidoreductase dimerisation protein n=1 Tax=Pseudoleptotrichia goodfellowii TaxID=157692 RepID=A0A510JCK7_9FUSO|nr:FAD-dependent oxidoreductase [Pseudoleptotrichia goodfellowii]BBM36927.1 pyridine nucleotide-disulfide oxidoreductase dimerisation protein [Pseudoleptotrichia goodfellowii]